MKSHAAAFLLFGFILTAAGPARAVAPFAFEGITITDATGTPITQCQPSQEIRVVVAYSLDRPSLVLFHGQITGADWKVELGYRVRLRLGGTYSVVWRVAIPFNAFGEALAEVTQYMPLFNEPVKQTASFTVTAFQADYVGSAACSGCHAVQYTAWSQTLHSPYVGCENCHGPGGNHVAGPTTSNIVLDKTASVCKNCHSLNDGSVIEAENGFIKPMQQYNEWVSTPHAKFLQCAGCHNPHYSVSKDPLRAIKTKCIYCHPFKRVYMGMQAIGCTSCHMAPAVNSGGAIGTGPYKKGDTPSHIWRIKPENLPGTMYIDGAVVKDAFGPFLTVDIACMSCHNGNSARLYDFESVRQTAPIVH